MQYPIPPWVGWALVLIFIAVALMKTNRCRCSQELSVSEGFYPQHGSSYGWNLADGAVWRGPATFVDEESPSQYL